MNNIVNSTTQQPTSDSVHYKKDCMDFICLNDGTIYRECKYCEHSLVCRQVDLLNGKPILMESHYCPVVDPITQKTTEWQYYCTGKYDHRTLIEQQDGDDKIS